MNPFSPALTICAVLKSISLLVSSDVSSVAVSNLLSPASKVVSVIVVAAGFSVVVLLIVVALSLSAVPIF